MLLISNRNPDKNIAGRNAEITAPWAARNWFFAAVEISNPCPRAASRKAAETAQSAVSEPRRGNPNSSLDVATADQHRPHAEHEVGYQLSQQDFQGAGGSCHERLHRAAFPFPGNDERGEERADDGHDEGQRAREQRTPAIQFGVVPESRLNSNQRLLVDRLVEPLLNKPTRKGSGGVVFHEGCRVRLRPVRDHLQRCRLAVRQTFGEVARDDDDPAKMIGDQLLFGDATITTHLNVKIGRVGEGVCKTAGIPAWIVNDQADPHMRGVQGQAVSEKKQQEQRQHECDENAAWVPHDLIGFLDDQGLGASKAIPET